MALGFEQNLNMNLTTSAGVQPLYQPVLNRHVLTMAKRKYYHAQFGQKAKIEKGKGKVVAWDKRSPLPKALVPLEEGITPKGVAINISRITGYPKQYGSYIATSDEFEFYTPDPAPEVLNNNETLANNAGETLDYLTARVLSTGTNVQYIGGKDARTELTETDLLTVDEIKIAVRTLKGNRAEPIDRDYVGIVHTDIAHDLTSDPDWEEWHKYTDPKNMYNGEIGRLWGVRFVETPDAIVFSGDPFFKIDDKFEGYVELSVVRVDGTKIYVAEEITAEMAAKAASRKILVNDRIYTIESATAGINGDAYITVDSEVDESIVVDMKIYPGEGGANGKPVYSTLIIGKNAYGVSDPKDIKIIMKQLGSGGTADPLDQRATHGWKAHHIAKILSNEYMVRIESCSSRY